MRKTLVALTLGLSIVLSVIFLAPAIENARAGFEPTPFQPEINQLGAVANILHSANFRVAKSIAHPPEPCVPPEPCSSPDLNGAVNRLEAIEKQVSSADDMVVSLLDEINAVMGVEPSPFRTDVIPALEVVRDTAGLIVEQSPPAGQLPAEYLDALDGVQQKAGDVIQTAQGGIDEINGSALCSTYETESDCDAAGCEWIAPHSGPAYCDIVGY